MRSCQFLLITTRTSGAGSYLAATAASAQAPRPCERRSSRSGVRRGGACAGGSHCAGSASRRGSRSTVKPAACSARSADSRPEPGPVDLDLEGAHAVLGGLARRHPRPRPARHRGSTCASPEAHRAGRGPGDRVAFCASVMVIIGVVERGVHVQRRRETMFLRSRRRTRVASLAMILLSSFRRARHSRR